MSRRRLVKQLNYSVPFQMATLILVLFMVCLGVVVPVTAQSRPWTAAASNGTIDEDSLSIGAVTNFVLGLNPGAIGTVTARYNITPTHDLSQFCPATLSRITIRFRDDDGAAAEGQVLLAIHRTSITSGADSTIYTFDSDVSGLPVGAAFQTYTTLAPIDFDFSTNLYWIEAQVIRTNFNRFINLGSMQIYESAGTPCP